MTRIQDLTIAERHAVVAGHFGHLADHTVDWDAPSPVAGWSARDVVGHLTSWFPAFLASGSEVRLPQYADGSPAGAWQRQTASIQSILDDPQVASQPFTDRHTGTLPIAEAVDQFYTPDVFMHSWDLARATGQPAELDHDFCAHLLAGMVAYEEAMRSSGQYGAAVPVAADADAQTRMLGFIGRDPHWRRDGQHA